MTHPKHVRAVELEARVLYSASPFDPACVVDYDPPILTADAVDELSQPAILAPSFDSFSTGGVFPQSGLEFQDALPIDDFGSLVPQPHSLPREIVFIDKGIDDWQQIQAGLTTAIDGSSHIAVILIDSNRDGIQQVSDALANLQDVAAIRH